MEISFHLIGEEQSIAMSVDGRLVSGRKLNQVCVLLNSIASELSNLSEDPPEQDSAQLAFNPHYEPANTVGSTEGKP